ncbi:hypothetical protein D3C87_574240 [compost metagenome]
MQNVSFQSKYLALVGMNVGDIVKLSNGQEASFIRLKQKKFEGNINGVPSNIPVEMFVSLVKKAEKNEGYKDLKLGEPFFVNKDGKALLFKFSGLEKDIIVGTNPIGNVTTRIPTAMFGGRVRDL